MVTEHPHCVPLGPQFADHRRDGRRLVLGVKPGADLQPAGGRRSCDRVVAEVAYPDGCCGGGQDAGRVAMGGLGQRDLACPGQRKGGGEPFGPDPALIGTDLEAFGEALEEARNASGDARLAACRRAVALYRGELVEGTGYEWAEPYAEAARRRALDAWTTIAEILQPADPDQALSVLETALGHDPYNEYLYVRIMRLQAAAGHPEAVRRTLALLESKLTDLGLTPSSQTRQAAASLLAAAGPGPGHYRFRGSVSNSG